MVSRQCIDDHVIILTDSARLWFLCRAPPSVVVREHPDMMSASEEGGGSWRSGRSRGGCLNFIQQISSNRRQRRRGSKNLNILWMSLMDASQDVPCLPSSAQFRRGLWCRAKDHYPQWRSPQMAFDSGGSDSSHAAFSKISLPSLDRPHPRHGSEMNVAPEPEALLVVRSLLRIFLGQGPNCSRLKIAKSK